jgi:hypothetical protein
MGSCLCVDDDYPYSGPTRARRVYHHQQPVFINTSQPVVAAGYQQSPYATYGNEGYYHPAPQPYGRQQYYNTYDNNGNGGAFLGGMLGGALLADAFDMDIF